MRVVIIGWYGTETLGDRGILAGILSLLGKTYQDPEVRIGSLYPYFSERTLFEDQFFYRDYLNVTLQPGIFDSRSVKALDDAISWADLVVMGGGPLMHIHDIFMVEYAFKKAARKKKKTMIFGCGVGPMFRKMHTRALENIIRHSTLTVFRDHFAVEYLKKLMPSGVEKLVAPLHVLPDPSVEALIAFRYKRTAQEATAQPFVAVNMRAFPEEYSKTGGGVKIDESLCLFVEQLSGQYPGKVRMIPMHYFFIGNDDRDFMNRIRFSMNVPDLRVQNVPLTLEQTMAVFADAELCIGMRFHAVVFQTVLNGKNFVLDYTEPGKGKIGGFLSLIGGDEFYRNRTINLQENPALMIEKFAATDMGSRFEIDLHALQQQMDRYPSVMKEYL